MDACGNFDIALGETKKAPATQAGETQEGRASPAPTEFGELPGAGLVAAAAEVEEEEAEGDQGGGGAKEFCEVEEFVGFFGGRD